MTVGRGVLYIEYSKDRKGEALEEPKFHGLKTITVQDKDGQQHGMAYRIDDERHVHILFHQDRVEVFVTGDCVEVHETSGETPAD